jgi:nucleoid-associated protein YgaU
VCIHIDLEEVGMSICRLAVTGLAMALIALVLTALTPGFPSMAGSLAAAQRTVDTAGPDALAISAAGLAAWAVWVWGAVGLALTAGSALPGMAGTIARVALHVVLPAGARRSAALALGLGIGVAAPLLGTATALVATPASAAVPAWSTGDVPDWPAAVFDGTRSVPDRSAPAAHPEAAVPDWPTEERAAGSHVVVRGDCLWHIAGARVAEELGRTPTDAEVAAEVHAWWAANADVIGPDPDLLLPGQVLHPPAAP